MKVIIDNLIDFEKYSKAPPEAAKIKTAGNYADIVLENIFNSREKPQALLPWGKTHSVVQLRPGELSIWAGYNGSGKSLLLGQVALSLLDQGEKLCIASFEMRPEITLERMAFQACGSIDPSLGFVKGFMEWADKSLLFYDQQGVVKSERILPLIRYCQEELGVTHIIIDSLMKCGIAVDDYNRQKTFIEELTRHAMDSGQHVHLVCHTRKGDSEFERHDRSDIKGASEITDQADNVFILWRNKRKEHAIQDGEEIENEPDAVLTVAKQRHGRWEGKIKLWFHPSGQYLGDDSARPMRLAHGIDYE
jgi:twinkle protein